MAFSSLSGFLHLTSWQRPPRWNFTARRTCHDDERTTTSPLLPDRAALGSEGGRENRQKVYPACMESELEINIFTVHEMREGMRRGSPSPSRSRPSFLSPFIRLPVRFVLNFQPHRSEGKKHERREREEERRTEEETSSSSIIHNSHSSCCPLHTREIERAS